MAADITFCSAMFCPLEELCLRKSYIGKPCDENLHMCDYKEGLEYNKEEDEYECVFGIPN